jgi:hypothetical protein
LLDGLFNVKKALANRWRSPQNPGDGIYGRSLPGTTAFPRTTNSRWVQNASFLTVKNITIGYTLPSLTPGISKLRIYASIQQALVLTGYDGANPEVSTNGLNGYRQGVDASSYPVPRTFAAGINVNF